MSLPAEDGVGSLCHKALQIISELCLGGQVEREKCAGIFPLESARQGISGTGTDSGPAAAGLVLPPPRGGQRGVGGRRAQLFPLLSLRAEGAEGGQARSPL